MFFADGEVGYIRDHGFHGDRIEAAVSEEQNILIKIEIFRGERAAHVIVLVPADAHEIFDVFDDEIETALAVRGLSDGVVHFLPAVQAQNDVFHLVIEKFRNVVFQQKSVRRESEEKFFAALCRLFFRVGDGLFDHVEIHERFAAEKVGFQNLARTRIFDEKIDRFFRRFQRHELAARLVSPFVRKTVLAAQIAVVADMQTKRLDLVALDGARLFLGREQKSRLFQFVKVRLRRAYFLFGDIRKVDAFAEFVS